MERWAPPDLPARWRVHASPFVGRRAEFRALDDLWDAVVSGAPQVVFIEGEAGAGKSRFIAEAGRVLHEHGAAVLLGACVAELGAPYQPFVAPVDALRSALADGAACDLAAPERRAAIEVLAGIAGPGSRGAWSGSRGAASGSRGAASGSRGAGSGGGGQVPPRRGTRRELYGAVCETLRAISRERPILLVLEDMHWAGATSLELLAHLTRHAGDARLLCLVSHRNAPPDRSATLAATIAELHRVEGVHRIRLTPLDVEDVADYLVARTGAPQEQARSAAPVLLERTGGNPFYLREVVRDLLDAGGLAQLGARVPHAPQTVVDLYAGRLAHLDATARRLLEIAAVVGDEFSLGLVARVAGTDVETTLAGLDVAVAGGLVRGIDEDGSAFAFDHVLGRQSVIDLIPRARLLGLHVDVARALEQGPVSAPNRIERIAHHFASAEVLGHRDEAVRYLTEAAALARGRLAHHEAGQAFARAAELSDDPSRRDTLRLHAAEAYRDAGAFATACELDRAVVRDGSPVDRLRAAVAFEGVTWRIGDLGFEAAELLTAALGQPEVAAAVEAEDPLRIIAVASLGRALMFTGDFERGQEVCTRAIRMARSTGDEAVLAHALACSIVTSPRPGTSREHVFRCEELVALGRKADDPSMVFHGASILEINAYLVGDVALYERTLAESVRAAAASGAPFVLVQASCHEWARAFARGDLDRADTISEELLEAQGVGTWADLVERLSLQTFVLRREQGRLTEVAPFISGSERVEQHWAPGLLALYVELGRRAPARRVLDWLVEQDPARFVASPTWPATITFVAEAASWLDHRRAAAWMRDLAAEFEGHNLAVGPMLAAFGCADRYLGMLDSTLGHRGAEGLLRSALDMDDRMGAPLFSAYDAVAMVEHLRRSGARSALVESARRDAAARVGALRSPRLSGRLELVVPPRRRADGLTRREIEVLRLLSQGLSNRELAERLFISENTVTNHVRSILLKTGVSNRTMASRYAAEHGVLDPEP